MQKTPRKDPPGGLPVILAAVGMAIPCGLGATLLVLVAAYAVVVNWVVNLLVGPDRFEALGPSSSQGVEAVLVVNRLAAELLLTIAFAYFFHRVGGAANRILRVGLAIICIEAGLSPVTTSMASLLMGLGAHELLPWELQIIASLAPPPLAGLGSMATGLIAAVAIGGPALALLLALART